MKKAIIMMIVVFALVVWPFSGVWQLLSGIIGGGVRESFIYPIYGGIILLSGIIVVCTELILEEIKSLKDDIKDKKKDADNFKFDEEVLYMKKSISRIIGLIMLIIAIVFIMFALNHPEKSFPWNNTITWLLYGVYFFVIVVLLIAPKMKK